MCLVLDYVPYGDMFTLWTFHGFFPEPLVKIYVAELSLVLGKCYKLLNHVLSLKI